MNNQFTSSENFLSFKSEEERNSVSFQPPKTNEEERKISTPFFQMTIYNQDFIFFIYRNVILALVVLLTTSGIYSILSNLQNYDSNCNFMYQASIANGFQSQSFLKNQPFFHLFAEIALILFFLIVRKQLTEKSKRFFSQNTKHSDFALLISGIRKESTSEELDDIKFFLQNLIISNRLINVNTVIFLFDDNRKFSGKAIICFQDYFGKEALLNFQKISLFERIKLLFGKDLRLQENDHRIHIENTLIVFEEVCEPQDIYWRNCNVSQWSKIYNQMVNTLLLAIFNLIFIIVEAIIIYYEVQLLNENEYSIIFLSMCLGVFMLVLNMVVYPKIVRNLSKKMRYFTKKEKQMDIFSKVVCMQLLNHIASFILAVLLFLTTWEKPGFIVIMNVVGLTIFIIPFLFLLIDPKYILSKYMNHNKPKYEEEKRLYFVASEMISTFFFFPFIPQNAIFSLIILIPFYFLEKFVILKKRKFTNKIRYTPNYIIDFFDKSVVALVLGIILVSTIFIQSNPNQILIISWMLAIFFLLLPKNWTINSIFKIHQDSNFSFSNDSNEANNEYKKYADKNYKIPENICINNLLQE